MPPWFIDRNIGIRKFKNDISLSDPEIATITNWVDAGAPQRQCGRHAAGGRQFASSLPHRQT